MKFFLVLSVLIQTTFAATTAVESDQWSKALELVQERVQKYGASNVLLVADIDNTIMTMPQDLGSDQWFNWQYEICIKDQTPEKKDCITRSMDNLIEIQGQLFAISNMVPTQLETASIIKKIQEQGVKTILLTSRGLEFRYSTERTLKNNDMWFADSAFGPKETFAAPFLPYDIKNPKASGLTDADVASAKLSEARPSTYFNGIFMTAGQHKGVMLKTLLHKTGSKFKAIVFIDDHKRHTDSVAAIIGNMNIDLATVRYSRIDGNVNKFNQSDKKNVIQAWNTLRDATTKVFN